MTRKLLFWYGEVLLQMIFLNGIVIYIRGA